MSISESWAIFYLSILFLVPLAIVSFFAYSLAKKLDQWLVFPVVFFVGGTVSFWFDIPWVAIFYWFIAIGSLIVLKFIKKW